MNAKQLRMVREIVRDADCRSLTPEEIRYIQNAIDSDLRKARLEEFKQHLDSLLEVYMADDEQFDEIAWTIIVNGKSIVLDNCAVLYNAIYDGIEELLNEY